jgi:hypothetical protein
MSDEILTIKEVPDYLKVAEKAIYRLAGQKTSWIQSRWHLVI